MTSSNSSDSPVVPADNPPDNTGTLGPALFTIDELEAVMLLHNQVSSFVRANQLEPYVHVRVDLVAALPLRVRSSTSTECYWELHVTPATDPNRAVKLVGHEVFVSNKSQRDESGPAHWVPAHLFDRVIYCVQTMVPFFRANRAQDER